MGISKIGMRAYKMSLRFLTRSFIKTRSRSHYFSGGMSFLIFLSFACRKAPVANHAAENRHETAQTIPAITSKFSSSTKSIILTKIPTNIFNVELQAGLNASRQPLTAKDFRYLMSTAKVLEIRNQFEDGWSYAPWYRGSFSTAEENYNFELFLGGRGKLISSTGEWCFFSFDPYAGERIQRDQTPKH